MWVLAFYRGDADSEANKKVRFCKLTFYEVLKININLHNSLYSRILTRALLKAFETIGFIVVDAPKVEPLRPRNAAYEVQPAERGRSCPTSPIVIISELPFVAFRSVNAVTSIATSTSAVIVVFNKEFCIKLLLPFSTEWEIDLIHRNNSICYDFGFA